jgi:type VI secretion system secreted protein VgrG
MDAHRIIGAITGGGLAQQNRLLKLDTPLSNNALIPHRVLGQSSIGRDYLFMVDCVSTSNDVELKTLISQPVTLWIQQTDKSYAPHHGYVHTARKLGADGDLHSMVCG